MKTPKRSKLGLAFIAALSAGCAGGQPYMRLGMAPDTAHPRVRVTAALTTEDNRVDGVLGVSVEGTLPDGVRYPDRERLLASSGSTIQIDQPSPHDYCHSLDGPALWFFEAVALDVPTGGGHVLSPDEPVQNDARRFSLVDRCP
ncbi:MAG: hypothetical protein OXT65_08175 [Alphaproteobacteria bacterium]|nr:hypothetical protein [Alphaproteobacteria bacterium]